MTRRIPLALLYSIAVVSSLLVQGVVANVPADGQVQRPSIQIAFVRHGNIWLLDAATSHRTRLTGEGHDSAPVWATDGRTILFRRTVGSRTESMRWRQGQGIRQVQSGLWSPDGQWIVFVRWRCPISHPAAAQLWAVRPNGTGARHLTDVDLPAGFNSGFGYYGSFSWKGLFALAP